MGALLVHDLSQQRPLQRGGARLVPLVLGAVPLPVLMSRGGRVGGRSAFDDLAEAIEGGAVPPERRWHSGIIDEHLAQLVAGRCTVTRSPTPSASSSARPCTSHDTSGGWRQPNTAAFELDSILSAEDTALLQSLMNAGSTDRVEFLGG